MSLAPDLILGLLAQVQKHYNRDLILNESDLEANLYHAFQDKFPITGDSFHIYTARKYYTNKRIFIVDCVIEDKLDKISAVFELKCDTYGYVDKTTSTTEGFVLKTQISWSDLYEDFVKMRELFSALNLDCFTDSRTVESVFDKLTQHIESYNVTTPLCPHEKIVVYVYSKMSSSHEVKVYSCP